MKPILEKLTTFEPQCSFVLQKDSYPYYPTPWHYHPEYELALVVKSSGQRMVGDSMDNFSDGDLVLMGPNLPHAYNNHPEYYKKDSKLTAEAVVIHFREDFLGPQFFDLPEMDSVRKLLINARWGLKILGETRRQTADVMQNMLTEPPARRLLGLLQILEMLSVSNEYRLLSSPGYGQAPPDEDVHRMTKVYNFVMSRFREPIKLSEVAHIAHLTPPSFCRFFKARTRKTFTQFLNEVRVGYACQLMSEEHLNISDICFRSGFNNLSNFNRQFKKRTRQSPLQYRKAYLSH
ncbi:MAG: AraC family transcriptional regulator [Tunicatimonas sp.]